MLGHKIVIADKSGAVLAEVRFGDVVRVGDT